MKVKQLCSLCEHVKDFHEHRTFSDTPTKLMDICWACEDWKWVKYHAFKLDNLKLIEDVAKSKGLI